MSELNDPPAFKGELPFDLSFELLGKRVTRRAKLEYDYTPEWRYFDLQAKATRQGTLASAITLHVEAIPEIFGDDEIVTPGTAKWVHMSDIIAEGVLPQEVWEAFDDAIDARCKLEDAQRRTAAKKR